MSMITFCALDMRYICFTVIVTEVSLILDFTMNCLIV
jgi:hypothetical protein